MKKRDLATVLVISIFLLSSVVTFGQMQVPKDCSKAGFPLRNGDFSQIRSGSSPAHWGVYTAKGKYSFTMDPLPKGLVNPPSMAVIEAIEPGNACYYQDMELPKGRYLFCVEILASPPAQAKIVLPGRTQHISSSQKWQKVSLEFEGDGVVRVHLFAVGAGRVHFKNASIKPILLESSPVPLADGTVLGGIVLPKDPTLPLEFAAFELQKYIGKMTGHTPGVEGRDKTFKGRRILLGAALGEEFKTLPDESYLVSTEKDIVLSGKIPRGTLYAVYDFLKLQGCGWYIPGRVGEVVPKKTALTLPLNRRIESPDYDVRGFLASGQEFFPSGGWVCADLDEISDWATRNRLNTYFLGGNHTIDLGSHRGHGHNQVLNHTWATFFSDDHPEWYVLVNGKRQKNHFSGRPNQLCVSNKELRKHVTQGILDHFKKNPRDKIFALNPQDDPCFWCECEGCRSLDSDLGKGPWNLKEDGKGNPELGMADRVLNFVNDIAERVSKVYPDKFVEVYAYGAYRDPPVREKVHPRVLIKYTLWPESPLNKPLLDTSCKFNRDVAACLDGWRKAGARNFGLYDYGNFHHGECPLMWFYRLSDSFKTLHEKWGFRHNLGETDNSIPASMMIYNLRAAVLWDTKTDYKKFIKKVCEDFYGPAGDTVYKYYMFMDDILMKSERWTKPRWSALDMLEYNLADMERGRRILETALQQVDGNEVLEHRIDIARFAHAYMTFTIAQNIGKTTPISDHDKQIALTSHELANSLGRKYKIMLRQGGYTPLQKCYFPPRVVKNLYSFPLVWKFKKDPHDKGLQENWYLTDVDRSWTNISTDKDWITQGHKYHGVAWYRVELKLPQNIKAVIRQKKYDNLSIYFGAVDGKADIFLDGNKVGEQKAVAEFMWDKPFTIKLPASFNIEASHEVVVRVQKDQCAAGIWKPVVIVEEK